MQLALHCFSKRHPQPACQQAPEPTQTCADHYCVELAQRLSIALPRLLVSTAAVSYTANQQEARGLSLTLRWWATTWRQTFGQHSFAAEKRCAAPQQFLLHPYAIALQHLAVGREAGAAPALLTVHTQNIWDWEAGAVPVLVVLSHDPSAMLSSAQIHWPRVLHLSLLQQGMTWR